MRVGVTGGRDYYLSLREIHFFFEFVLEHDASLVLGDCETGVDKTVEDWARKIGVSFTQFHACHLWATLGKKAGPIRNAAMARYMDPETDILIAFPGGRGTCNMMQQAKKRHIPIMLWVDLEMYVMDKVARAKEKEYEN